MALPRFTVVTITQIIEQHPMMPQRQKILLSEQSQIDTETLFRAEELQQIIQGKVKDLYDTRTYLKR